MFGGMEDYRGLESGGGSPPKVMGIWGAAPKNFR